MNQRITKEMSDFLSTVSSQIQKAINEAISDQLLPQIQATLKADKDKCPTGSGKTRLEDRNTDDLKKPWTVGLGATPDMSLTGCLTEMTT